MRVLFGQVVFDAGGRSYAWEDIVLAAMWWGEWAGLEEQARQGIACAKHLDEGDGECDPDEVTTAADEFRYARDLLTVEETEAWLARWALTAETWMDAIQRSVLRRAWEDSLGEIVEAYPVCEAEVDAAIHADGVCSGAFARFALKLAGRAAAHDRLGPPPGEPPPGEAEDPDSLAGVQAAAARAAAQGLAGLPAATCRDKLRNLGRLERAFQRLSREALTPKAIRDAIAARHLDWISLRARAVAFTRREEAQEGMLCVREEGSDLAAVARAAGAALREMQFILDEAEPAIRDALLGSRPGDVVGPLAVNGGFSLLQVVEKRMPSAEDPEVHRRAEQHILERAVDHEVTQRVRWHFSL